jgi:glycosyl transferase family 87
LSSKLVNSVLSIVLVGGIYLGIILHPVVKQNVEGGYFDFVVLYTGGKIVKEGQARHLYDYGTQQEAERSVTDRPTPLPFNHTPFEALLFAPLAFLPYLWAYRIWVLVNFGLIGCSAWLLRSYLRDIERLWLRLVFVLSSFVPLFVGIVQGQDSLLMLLLFTLAFVSLKRGRESRAGCFLALALLKCQYVLPFVAVFFVKRRWKLVSVFLAGSVLMGLVSLWLVGWSGARDLMHLLQRQNVNLPNASQNAEEKVLSAAMPNLRGLLDAVLAGRVSPTSLTLVVAVCSIILVVWGITRWGAGYESDGKTLDLLLALNLVIALLVSYYEFIHDLVLISLPVLIVFSHFETSRIARPLRRLMSTGAALLLFLVEFLLFDIGSRQFWVLSLLLLALAFLISAEISDIRTAPGEHRLKGGSTVRGSARLVG